MNKNHFLALAILCLAMLGLTGCLSAELKSMGTYPMPVAHQPRIAPDSKEVENVVSADGFTLFNQGWSNTEKIYGGGGFLSAIHRMNGWLSPMFASVTVGGYGGNLNFACDYDEDCSEEYLAWLKTSGDRYDISFWAIQERFMAGFEFNTPINLFLGFGGGILMYQSGGEYDDARKDLDRKFRKIYNKDGAIDAFLLGSIWLGYHIGKNAKYGSISVDLDISNAYLSNYVLSTPINIGYFHPSGFHGGIGANSYGVDLFFGKSFKF